MYYKAGRDVYICIYHLLYMNHQHFCVLTPVKFKFYDGSLKNPNFKGWGGGQEKTIYRGNCLKRASLDSLGSHSIVC